MLIKKPRILDAFTCKGGECTDTCCRGWQLIVDERAYQRLKEEGGEIGEEFIRKTVTNKDGEMILPEIDGKCPFLDSQGLCRVISRLGQEFVPDICQRHPRYYNLIGDLRECGLGLSCPEAAELFLKMPKSALTEMTVWEARQLDNDIPYESMYSDESLLKIIKMRDDLMEKASSSSDPVSLFGGIFSLSEYIKRNSDEASDFEAIFADEALAYRFEGSPLPEETVRDILGLVGELEYASFEFSKELGAMAKKVLALPRGAVEEVLRADGELAGKAVIYFLHRYLAVGLATGEVGRMMGLAVSLATLFLIYVNQFTEKAKAIADFSRNIEYSEYNVELIASLQG